MLKIVHAQHDVHHAERALAECVIQEHKKIANLHRFKSKQMQDSVHHLDLNIVRVACEFESPKDKDVRQTTDDGRRTTKTDD